LILALGAITTIIPFYWMVATSLKSLPEIMMFPPTLFPKELHFENYILAWRTVPFATFFKNSAVVSLSVVLGQLFTCSLAGYAFARLRFPGRDQIFLLYLSTMMIPFAVIMIPMYILMRTFGWIDNHLALIVPSLVSVFGTFLMRQFFSTIPKDLEDAARIDGCSYFKLYRVILLPIAKPALATLGILTFMNHWNDFLWPLIIISTVPQKTLPLGLLMFIEQQAIKTPWNLFNAAGVFSIVPILVIFALGQKYYVQGIVTSGLKGSA
jgi:multiple sugar transport system permease protein